MNSLDSDQKMHDAEVVAPPPSEGDVLPETCPSVEPMPARAFRLHWVLVPLVAIPAILLPRRFGAYLAASRLRDAYAAHILAFAGLSLAASITMLIINPSYGMRFEGLTWTDCLRLPFATLVTFMAGELNDVVPFLSMLVTGAVLHVGLWIAAMLWMPWFAAGESPGRLYLRSVKLMLWSALPAALVAVVMMAIAIVIEEFGLYHLGDEVYGICFVAVLCSWWLWVVLRWGDRYAGPASGSGFEPRPLRCEGCGYPLVYLPEKGRCPECGRNVRESLPTWRQPPAFGADRALFWRLPKFLPTLLASLRARRFASRLAVHSGRRQAREFALLVCLMVGMLVAVASGMLPIIQFCVDPLALQRDYEYIGSPRFVDPVQVSLENASTVLPIGFICAFGLVSAATWLATAFGWYQPARRGLIMCYASGWLVVPGILAMGGIWASFYITEIWQPDFDFRLPAFGPVDGELALLMGVNAPAVIALLLWFVHINAMFRATRFANA